MEKPECQHGEEQSTSEISVQSVTSHGYEACALKQELSSTSTVVTFRLAAIINNSVTKKAGYENDFVCHVMQCNCDMFLLPCRLN